MTRRQSLSQHPRRLLVVAFVGIMLLAGCAMTTSQTTTQSNQSGGGPNPEAVTESFFTDLSEALRDPQISDDKKRSVWVERLAGYFAPNERDDQRIALDDALTSFTTGLSRLEANESMTLKVRFDGTEKLSENGNRALVRLVNGNIYLLITRTTEKGTTKIWEQSEPLETIIGGTNGAVPVIRIGSSWFLSEG